MKPASFKVDILTTLRYTWKRYNNLCSQNRGTDKLTVEWFLSARTKAALTSKRARGEKTGGDVPFGYALQDDGTHLGTDADEQEAIEIIAELRRRGYILRRICSELEKRGVKTKNGKAKWHPQVISQILNHAA